MSENDPLRQYELKKARVVAEFREAQSSGASVGLGKKTSNLFRQRSEAKRLIDVTDLNRVLAVDETNLVAEVEGMISFDDFTKEMLKYGLLPAVVPELKSITVGGAAAGVAIESSSFRYGLVHETLRGMEILTGTGEVVDCTRSNEHRDLFFGFPNSYGTLGYALKLAVQLVPAKPFVELRHRRFTEPQQFFRAMDRACRENEVDFVEGALFDRDVMYLSTARFVDSAPFRSDYTYRHIYYKSIPEKEVDYLSAYDYIWRWDTDWFWCSRNFGLQRPLLRALARPWLHSTAYWRIMRWNRKHRFTDRLNEWRGVREESVIQDVQVPLQRAPEFLALFQEKIGITPVWICPTRAASPERYPSYDLDYGRLYLNFGFWDVLPLPADAQEGHYNRQVEQWVDRLEGRKSLYSTVFYDKEKFWQLYDGDNYQDLKKRYDPAGNFGDLYDKAVLRR